MSSKDTSGGVATGTIVDNDEVTVADITDATAEEGENSTFNVTMSARAQWMKHLH
jgi:hypothetical protein